MHSKRGFSLIFLIITICIVLIVVSSYLYLSNFSTKKNQNASYQLSQDAITSGNTQSDLKTYKDQVQHFTIELPPGIKLADHPSSIKIQTTGEIRAIYKTIKENEGWCPGPCGAFVDDLGLIDKQFEILSEAANSKSCSFNQAFIKDITDRFRLFARAIEHKVSVEGIYNPNLGICGIKFIAADGYDVSIQNFVYKAGFLKDNKVISIEFGLFVDGVSEGMNKLLRDFGEIDGSCNAVCYEKESKYFEELLEDSQKLEQLSLKEVIEIYNKTVQSFELND